MAFRDVNGARLYYEEHGTGPQAIVFAHSLLFSCRMFDDQVAVLKDRYRCVAFDFRGQGQSEVTRDGYDMDTLAGDAAALIQTLNDAPCHFVGFSMGGFVGLRLAIRRPELLRSLVLIDTSADPEPRENLPKYRLLNLITRWIGPWAVAKQVMPIMFGPRFLHDPERKDLRERWRRYLVANDRIGVTRAVAGVIDREGVQDDLHRIGVPTLILVGEKDTATTPQKAERMRAGIARSSLVVVPHAGHMSPVEEPAAVTAAVAEFLARVG